MEHRQDFAGASALMSSKGGELISYKRDGVEYVWRGEAAYWAGHAPVLFPNVCTLYNGKARIEGREYTLARHGFARKSEFALTGKTDDSLTFTLCDSADTISQYPFAFALNITHTLTPTGFQTHYEVVNRDNRAMPFCIGAHAGFSCPIDPAKSFSSYSLVFEGSEAPAKRIDADGYMREGCSEDVLRGGNTLRLDHSLFDDDVLIFDSLLSRSVLLRDDEGRGIRFSFNGFSAFGVWSPVKKNAPFICLEPWQGLPGAASESGDFLSKPYCVTLLPGEAYRCGYSMDIL